MEILINDHSLRIELTQGRTRPKVACLGPIGTYTEAARFKLLGKYLDKMDAHFLLENDQVVREVEAGNYDLGFVPIENAIEGDVIPVLRELNHARNITILGETILGIEHMLLGWPGEQIEKIYSHPQALGQSRTLCLESYPQAKQIETTSTSAAAELVADEYSKGNKRVAAIASRRAGEYYNLPILAENIGDVKGNSTRFLMLGRGETYPTGQDSTALIFIPRGDRPGILARCLTALASYGINLTKLDSRPTGVMREYAFWVTMDGHSQNEMVRRGIDDLRKTYCSSLRVLGSYRKAELPTGVKEPGVINGQ